MKTCNKCGEQFPATPEYFYRESRNNSGLGCWCKACKNKYTKSYKEQAGYRKVSRKYAEEDNYSIVEDDQFKKITVKCFTCSAELEILFDTQSGMRAPRKQCYKCKYQFENDGYEED